MLAVCAVHSICAADAVVHLSLLFCSLPHFRFPEPESWLRSARRLSGLPQTPAGCVYLFTAFLFEDFPGTGSVRLWDFATRRGPVRAVAFSPDGKVLAIVDGEHRMKLWSIDPR